MVWLSPIRITGLAVAAGTGVGALAVTRQRVATVADIAALAGAQAVVDQCGTAVASVEANGMAAVSCALDGDDVGYTQADVDKMPPGKMRESMQSALDGSSSLWA